jgi:hypothetical protein
LLFLRVQIFCHFSERSRNLPVAIVPLPRGQIAILNTPIETNSCTYYHLQ